MLVGMAFAYVPINFGVNVVKEKQQKAKHQQIVMGTPRKFSSALNTTRRHDRLPGPPPQLLLVLTNGFDVFRWAVAVAWIFWTANLTGDFIA